MRRVVVFRHGILINRFFLEPLARHLRRRGFEVRNRSYGTTRKRIEEHAADLFEELRALADELGRFGEPCEIDVVTHSMGGLVLRYALTHFPVPPVRRGVLIVPPNRGSKTARGLRHLALYRWLAGASGLQLAEDPAEIFASCGRPRDTELGIIAGSGGRRVLPGELPEPHDGVVSVAEARLDGFPLKELPYGHTPILFRKDLHEEVVHFLEHGAFGE